MNRTSGSVLPTLSSVPYLIAILGFVVLTSPFGTVEGEAVADEVGLTVRVTIEVDHTFEAVIVRPFSPFEELAPTALRPIDSSTWGGLVVLPSAGDWSLVFDAHEAGGETARSDSVTLAQIGVDAVVLAGDPTLQPLRTISRSTWWLIGAMLFAIAALSTLAWWTFTPTKPKP